MTQVMISGAGGRMGRQVIAAIAQVQGLTLSGALEAAGHPAVGTDAGRNAGLSEMGVIIVDDLKKALSGAQVVIDFSTPASCLAVMRQAAQSGVRMVAGTTGLTAENVKEAESLAKKIPIVMSPNMSVGVNLLFALSDQVARVLGDSYDIEIIEAHHNQKADAPSGTARRLLEIISGALTRDPRESAVYGREGMVGKRTKKEIGVHAVRAGDIVGEHTVLFATEGERIELVHRATSRMILARGAVRAAGWIVDKGPGLYDMQDVLGLRMGH